jgi:hypothetical protein
MDDLDLGATLKGFVPGQKVFNRYTLTKILGRGGMGVVWLARDGELERDVALKFLPEVVALDKESLDELKRETRRNLELTHTHIVRIYDFIQGGRSAAIAMEYVDGASLSALKTEQPDKIFPVARLAVWAGQICEALEYAHTKAKIVHRDIKPANLMVDARGEIKVTDFGIARSISDSVSRVSAQAGSSGTPVYMSPQQMMGDKAAVSDDVYALGATLYELLTGKPPFHTGNIIVQVQNKVPPTIAARREELGVKGDPVPAHWETAIAACLAKEPGDRPKDMATLAKILESGSGPVRGADLNTTLFLTAAEMAAGGEMPVIYHTGVFKLRIDVAVPPGVKAGTVLRLRGSGNSSPSGGESGDLLITVQLREDGAPKPADPFDVFREAFQQTGVPPGESATEPPLIRAASPAQRWQAWAGSALVFAVIGLFLHDASGEFARNENWLPEGWRYLPYGALILAMGISAVLGAWATKGRLSPSAWAGPVGAVAAVAVLGFETDYFLLTDDYYRYGSFRIGFFWLFGMTAGMLLAGCNLLLLRRHGGVRPEAGHEFFLGLAGGLVATSAGIALLAISWGFAGPLDHVWSTLACLGWLQVLRYLMVQVRGSAPSQPAPQTSRWWLATAAAVLVAVLAGWYFGWHRPKQDDVSRLPGWNPAALDAMHSIEVTADPAAERQRLEERQKQEAEARERERQQAEERERRRVQEAYDALLAEVRALGTATTEPAVSALEQRISVAPFGRDELLREFQERREQRTQALRLAEVQAGIRRVALGSGAPMEFLPVAAGVVPRTGGTLRFTRSFWIAAKPVTQAQWQALMPRDSTPEHQRGPELPARMMSWVNAREFCEKLTAQERAAGRLPAAHEFSLPTEAELEFAYAGYGNSPGITALLAKNDPTRRGWAEWTLDGFAPPVSGDLTDPRPVVADDTKMLTRWTTGQRSFRNSRSGDAGDEMVLRIVLRPVR